MLQAMLDDNYFSGINALLIKAGLARPCIFIDLRRLDHNIDLINASMKPPFQFRLVTKSLPCAELISHIMKRTGTSRLMAFHQPYVRWIIDNIPDADILFGKPMLVQALAELFQKLPDSKKISAESRIQWLVDTPGRLREFGEYARDNNLNLRINIEIDIGLGRGGIEEVSELNTLLSILKSYAGHLVFSGFMGYDAHVPYMPAGAGHSFAEAMDRYEQFTGALKASSAGLLLNSPTFNSGGSKTWQLFSGDIPVNDVSVGSALLKPATFSSLHDHLPAMFIAAPVLKQFERRHKSQRNPRLDTCNYVYGGGWAADLTWPDGTEPSSLSDPPNENLMPNQSLYYTRSGDEHSVGDFIFFHPKQSDAMFQFEDILVIEDGRITDTWHPIPVRF
jgi:D-serine deaminase-like pyridoxal phosphate-dependent protein